MILAGVLIDKNSESALKKIGVRDSKTVLHSSRVKMSETIKNSVLSYHVVKSIPSEIDKAINDKINLNTLEAMKAAAIVNELNSGKEKIKVIVDCPSVNTKKWREKMLEFVDKKENLEVLCEHKADEKYVSVSAASILAKVVREEEVSKIKKEYGEIGSGYPADPITKEFLDKKGKELRNSGIFRKSWSTWKNKFPGDKQSSLF
jgi:ribonuclease HII